LIPSVAQMEQTGLYDPFTRGRFPVGVHTVQALDTARGRTFPCEIWYPAASQHAGQDLSEQTWDVYTTPTNTQRRQTAIRDAAPQSGTYPLVLFSHPSGGNRRSATFLCTHLSSHGYVVAALTHSEVVAPELARKENENEAERAARAEAVIGSRVPDLRFLLDQMLSGAAWESEAKLDATQVGVVGHSFGGWTALAAPDTDQRIRSVVALAPGGNSNPRPGILKAPLAFAWGRNVSTLLLVAENDVPLPLDGMYEIFQKVPSTKQMLILRRADHGHFMDNVEEEHEAIRKMPVSPQWAYMQQEMRPISELCSGEMAHLFVRGLTLSHFDSTLRRQPEAQEFLTGNLQSELMQRGVEAMVHKP
jgi:dienelactone hydrolase